MIATDSCAATSGAGFPSCHDNLYQRLYRFQGGFPLKRFAKLVVGVSKLRRIFIFLVSRSRFFFSSQFFRTYLSTISSPIRTPVPPTGVITKSVHAIVLCPFFSRRPTFPIFASLMGPNSNCVLHAVDQTKALNRLSQYFLDLLNSSVFDRSLLFKKILPVAAPW